MKLLSKKYPENTRINNLFTEQRLSLQQTARSIRWKKKLKISA